MTTGLTREQTIAALQRMVRQLNHAIDTNEWDLHTVRVLHLAEQISDWMDSRPRRWALPDEPDCPVRDASGWLWEHTDATDAPWQSGRIATTWPMLLTRGPLTEETP